MKLLARSLLALAAVLAAADAISTNPNCNSKLLGEKIDDDYIDFVLHTPGDRTLLIPNKCVPRGIVGRMLKGEYIYVCNSPNYRPTITPVYDEYGLVLSSVHIGCPEYITGCNNLEVKIRQYCGGFY